MKKPHDWVALNIFDSGPSGSKDTISQCARCNMLRHDYEYDGGKKSPNYPTHHLRGMGVVDEGCARGDMAEEEAAADNAGQADPKCPVCGWVDHAHAPNCPRRSAAQAESAARPVDAIARDVHACATAWEPGAMLMGNVRADEVAVLAVYAMAAYLDRAAASPTPCQAEPLALRLPRRAKPTPKAETKAIKWDYGPHRVIVPGGWTWQYLQELIDEATDETEARDALITWLVAENHGRKRALREQMASNARAVKNEKKAQADAERYRLRIVALRASQETVPATDSSGETGDREWLLDEIDGARAVLASIERAAMTMPIGQQTGTWVQSIRELAAGRKASLDSVLRVAGRQSTPKGGQDG